MDWAKLWPSLLATVPTILAPFYDSITQWISLHPGVALIVGTLATVLANLAKSPTQPSQ